MVIPVSAKADRSTYLPADVARKVKRIEQAVSITDAVVFDREKNQNPKRDQNEQPPADQHSAEVPLEVYTNDAHEAVVTATPAKFDVTA